MLERNFQKLVIKELERVGSYILNVEGLKVGVPDIICCFKGNFVGIELKVDYKLQAAQALQLQKIRDNQGIAFCLTYSDNWKRELWDYINGWNEYEIPQIDWE